MSRARYFPTILPKPEEADLIAEIRAEAERAFANHPSWARRDLVANYAAIRLSGERGTAK